MIANNPKAYPVKVASSGQTPEIPALNKNTSRIILSEMTKGLKLVMLLTAGEMVSMGRTIPDTNNNKLPVEMEAKAPVSSDLKEYPIPMPINENTEEESSNTPATGNSCAKFSLRKIAETASMTKTCTEVITKVVRYVDKTKVPLRSGKK